MIIYVYVFVIQISYIEQWHAKNHVLPLTLLFSLQYRDIFHTVMILSDCIPNGGIFHRKFHIPSTNLNYQPRIYSILKDALGLIGLISVIKIVFHMFPW